MVVAKTKIVAQRTWPRRCAAAPILPKAGFVTYNARTISSHVTGETPDSSSGTRWASTGKREISIAVRLGSQDGKQVEAARHSPLYSDRPSANRIVCCPSPSIGVRHV